MQIGVGQGVMAQLSIVPEVGLSSALSPEHVVDRLVQRNLAHANGLAAYQGDANLPP